jgi:hypothetical protein
MSIVLTLPDDFEIENYTGLQSFLTEHLQLDDETVDQLPNLIRLAEYRLNRLVLAPERETQATLSTTAETQIVALPTGFRQAMQLKILGDQSTGYPLEPVSQNVVESYDYPGKPVAYAIVGNSLLLGPVPDAVYTLTLTYIQKLTPLTVNAQTNWLLAENADAYVYMASAVISFHLGDEGAASAYNALAESVMGEINQQGNRKRVSAPMRLRSPVVV